MGAGDDSINASDNDIKAHNTRLKHILRESQKEAFIKTARSLECDESEAAFNAELKKLAAKQPRTAKPKKKSQQILNT